MQRKKYFTEQDILSLRSKLNILHVSPGHFAMYNLVSKQTNWGFSSNDRLFVLHTNLLRLSYISKLPLGLIPFHTQAQILSQLAKESISREDIETGRMSNFRCQNIPDKLGCLQIAFQQKDIEVRWVLKIEEDALRKQWVDMINAVMKKDIQKMQTKYLQFFPLTSQPEKLIPAQLHNIWNNVPIQTSESKQEEGRVDESIVVKVEDKIEQIHVPSLQLQSEISPIGSRVVTENNFVLTASEHSEARSRANSRELTMKLLQLDQQDNDYNGNQQLEDKHIGLEYKLVRKRNLSLSRSAIQQTSEDREQEDAKIDRFRVVEQEVLFTSQLPSKDWNRLFCEREEKFSVFLQFTYTCHALFKELVDQIGASIERDPSETKCRRVTAKNITISLLLNGQGRVIVNKNQQRLEVESWIRQFYNYDLIVAQTGNKGKIRAPLCGLFEYKGLLGYCIAKVSQYYTLFTNMKVNSEVASELESVCRARPTGNYLLYRCPDTDYYLINELIEFIPFIPNTKQCFPRAILTRKGTSQSASLLPLEASVIHKSIDRFMTKLETAELHLTCTTDLERQLEAEGIPWSYLPQMYKQSVHSHFKRIFGTEICAIALSQLLRNELHEAHYKFAVSKRQKFVTDDLDMLLLQHCKEFLESFFTAGEQSQKHWKAIEQELKRDYSIELEKKNVLGGYLLSAVLHHVGVVTDFGVRCCETARLFVTDAYIPKSFLAGLQIKSTVFSPELFLPELRAARKIVETQWNTAKSVKLKECFRQLLCQLPTWMQQYFANFRAYLSKGIPPDQREKDSLYQCLNSDEPNVHNYQISLQAIKWLLKEQSVAEATQLKQKKTAEIRFWVDQSNPFLSKYEDIFAMYYIADGDEETALSHALCSKYNMINVFGEEGLPVSDKHFILASIYLKADNREEALSELARSKAILQVNNCAHCPEYGLVLLKISNILLCQGKPALSVPLAAKATLNYCGNNGVAEEDEARYLELCEIQLRNYQLLKDQDSQNNLCFDCAKCLAKTTNVEVFSRMVRLVLYSTLKSLGCNQAQTSINLLSQIHETGLVTTQTKRKSVDKLKEILGAANLASAVNKYFGNIAVVWSQLNRRDNSSNGSDDARNASNFLREVTTIADFSYVIGLLSLAISSQTR